MIEEQITKEGLKQ